jgi:DNA-binding ferritin-like protein (Dps family)
MKIKKDEARKLAKQILNPKVEEFKNAMLKLECMVQEEYIKKLPSKIRDAFGDDTKDFFHQGNYRTGIRQGENKYGTNFTLKPCTLRINSLSSVDFSKEIIDFNKEVYELHDKIKKSEEEITEYIYRLGTPEKIFKVFKIEVKLPEKQTSLINPEILSWVLN